MNANQNPIVALSEAELRAHWKSIMFEGVLFLILGLIALIVPAAFSIGFELVVGWLFLIGGGVQLYRSIQSNMAPGFWMMVLSALISMIFGVLLVFHPLQGLVALTAIIAAFFMVEGVLKIVFGFAVREFASWGWVVLSGVCSLFISLIVFTGFPFTASWFIGTLIGVYLILNGLSFIMVSSQAHMSDMKTGK